MKTISKALLGLILLATIVADAQVFTTRYNFSALVSRENQDGAQVSSPLLPARDGNLYGAAYEGGTNGTGTVFQFSPGSGFKIVHTFSANPNQTNTDGAYPYAGVIQDGDGNFYGTTEGGGAYGYGTVFQMTASGTVTLLHSFNYSDGENPGASLTPAGDGNFYGAALLGGTNGNGSIFRVDTNGTFQSLHDFAVAAPDASNNYTNLDGSRPYGTLMPGGNGYLYGTTFYGGTNGNGTIFRFNTNNGAFDVLHTFGAVDVNYKNPDGANPYAGLTLGSNGIFFGTATYAGTNGNGTVFQISTSGVFSVLHHFSFYDDGADPSGTLVQGRDGNFYGTTESYAYGYGTMFQITTNGALTPLHFFSPLGSDGSDGSGPYAGLVIGSDGYFYGTTWGNGANTNGTIFQVIFPGLAISNLPGRKVLVSWPTNQAGFTLQISTNLLSTNWLTASPSPMTLNDQFVVTNDASGPKSFYRLKK